MTVELIDTRDAGVVWADRHRGSLDDVHRVLEEIRSRILTALEIRIPLHEATLARLKVTEDLDAWAAYHLGLQHVYRFNRRDNQAAAALFRQAVTLDPGFARAHVLIAMIATAAHAAVGDDVRAAAWRDNVRSRNPVLTREDLFRSFPIKSDSVRTRVAVSLARFGF